MFNPLYIEIYQFAGVVFTILFASLMFAKVRYWKREAEFYQKEFTAAWKRAQWETHQKNRQLPEDWSLRGAPADWEGIKGLEFNTTYWATETNLRALSDEVFAKLVLESVQERLKWHRDTRDWRNVEFTEYAQDKRDKVFTRLAGRIFRAVEKHRNL